MIRIFILILLTLPLFWVAGLTGFYVNTQGMAAPYNGTTDSIIVLTGGADRINAGLDLFANGKSTALFISGVNEKVTEKDLIALWNQNAGTIPCCITLGHDAHNTFENARETQLWTQKNDIKTAIILTTDYHMPRAWLEFTAQMPHITFYSHTVPSPKTNWFLIFGEYNKTLYTFLRLKLNALKS